MLERCFGSWFILHSQAKCIFCDEETRLQRAKEKNNFSQEKYEKLSNIQFSQEKKKKYADYIIESGKAGEELKANIKEILEYSGISFTLFRINHRCTYCIDLAHQA